MPADGRYEWTGEQWGDDLEVLFQTPRGRRAYIRNMDVDVCCCSESPRQHTRVENYNNAYTHARLAALCPGLSG